MNEYQNLSFKCCFFLQKKELPKDTEDNPWKMSADEISSRRDLRDSHLIFSIDPKGCEDVDDTLSVRLAYNCQSYAK